MTGRRCFGYRSTFFDFLMNLLNQNLDSFYQFTFVVTRIKNMEQILN